MSHPMQNQPHTGGTDPADVQGEGDYDASRRYRQDVSEFLERADVESLARQAAPGSALEARELALAQERGAQRSKGDDPTDVGTMYPGHQDPDSGGQP